MFLSIKSFDRFKGLMDRLSLKPSSLNPFIFKCLFKYFLSVTILFSSIRIISLLSLIVYAPIFLLFPIGL